MKFIGIIPARYASSRFPGKPLADLGGKPVIQWVYEQASKALATVMVATDDARIYDCVLGFGGNVVMTSPNHTCGTDRVYEAYQAFCATNSVPVDEDIVVINIQGDEPFIQPEQIEALMACFPTEIATLVHPFTSNITWEELANPNYVKVAIAREKYAENESVIGKALYFSRSVIPYVRGMEATEWLQHGQHYRHIGMYAYRADILRTITQLPPSALEQLECLEQLRWLENGLTIRVAETHYASIGIDTPEDLEQAVEQLKNSRMSVSKWILGGLGFVMGGPIGALIGVFVASLFDTGRQITASGTTEWTSNTRQRTHRATQGDIQVSIVVLIACVIKADGRVLKAEINYIKPFLLRNFGEEGAKQALQLLKELIYKDIDATAVAQQIRQYVNYSTRLELVHLLLDLANADGEISGNELRVIEQISINMAVQSADYQSLLALYQRHKDVNWAYTALEIEPTATDAEVKKAYRRMAMKYHPDKVANAGEEIRKQATEKFRGINEAYEHIKQQRGL